ncbi:MAG: universal stress protein [Fimbriimonadaceae bacterium]|nr:universal stress protein [Fimbriimonadaceae bacterium]
MSLAVIGVDVTETHQSAVELLQRLALQDLKAELVTAIEPILADVHGLGPTHPVMELHQMQEQAARRRQDEVAAGLGGQVTRHLETGDALHLLRRRCEESSADLAVVGASRKGWLAGLFLGSVPKGLCENAPCSFLVGKHPPANPKLSAVIAFDGSGRSRDCLLELKRLRPQGIGTLHIVAGYGVWNLENGERHPPEAAQEQARGLERQCESLAAELQGLAETITVEVFEGDPNSVIHAAMAEHDADLLVMGAGGHGWLERLILGSTTMHQVLREEHNVLVLKPKSE